MIIADEIAEQIRCTALGQLETDLERSVITEKLHVQRCRAVLVRDEKQRRVELMFPQAFF